MRPDRRNLRDHLDRMGAAPVPPPSPAFVARTEERLRALRHVTAVEGPEPRAAAPRRPRLVLAAVAAVAVVVAALVAVPRGDGRVSLTTDGGATTTTPTTPAPPPPTTVVEPAPAPVPATVPTTLPPPTAPPTTAVPVRPRPAPTTTTTTTAPTTTVAPTTLPAPVTTTTTKPAPARIELRCTAGAEAGAPAVTCTWSGVADPSFAGWRLHRAVGTAAKQVLWTSPDPSTVAYVDLDVAPATAYHYLVEAIASDGRTLAKGGIATVECCPP